MDSKDIRDTIEKSIANHFMASGQFQIRSAEAWYLKNGRFNETQALDNAAECVDLGLKKGYSGIRAAGDVAAIPASDRLDFYDYEEKVDSLIKEAPLIALCAYPILDCTLRETKMVIECHDDVLMGQL